MKAAESPAMSRAVPSPTSCHHNVVLNATFVTASPERPGNKSRGALSCPIALSPPSDRQSVCGLGEAVFKLIYFNWHCCFLGWKWGKKQASISSSPFDFSLGQPGAAPPALLGGEVAETYQGYFFALS